MDKRLKSALNKVYAEDALMEQTAARLSAEIRRGHRRKVTRFRLAAACASLLVFFALGGLSLNLYLTPSAYIDVDVNPSIELITNRFGRVIGEHAYNDDGQRILAEVSVRNLGYSEALDRLIGAMKRDGYLGQDALVSVTVQTQDSALLRDVQASVNTALQSHHLAAEADVFAVTQDVKATAGEHHLSPAKYLAITKLQQVDPTATIEGCRDHSISELRQFAQEHTEDHKSVDNEHDDEQEDEHALESSSPAACDADAFAPSPFPQSAQDSSEHSEKAGDHHGGHH